MEPFAPSPPSPRILPRCRAPAPSRAGPSQARPLRPAGPTFAITASRCNRCGACLRLGCGAIADEGGEALVVEPAQCSGCGDCAPLCRARAIGPLGP